MNQTTREKAVSQCVEEAALLWLRREHLIGEPHLSLPDLADRDRQLQSRLDELVAAGDLGWRACQRELGWEEPGEIFPATFLALAENSRIRLTRVLDYAVRSYELSRPLVAGLAWAPLDGIVDLLEDFLTADDARLRGIGLAAAIAHRQVPESALADALEHPHGGLRARALRGVGEMGCLELVPARRRTDRGRTLGMSIRSGLDAALCVPSRPRRSRCCWRPPASRVRSPKGRLGWSSM